MPDPAAHSTALSLLADAPPNELKALAEALLKTLERDAPITVLENRTGLVMLPYRDTVQGAQFHLGEVLIAEARVRHADTEGSSVEGYGAMIGRDLEAALAMAIIDLAWQSGSETVAVNIFLERVTALRAERLAALAAKVEATRVHMETF